MGKGHRKGNHEEEVLVRTPELERRYTAPPSATQHNVTSYLFCLSLYLRKVIRPIEETNGTIGMLLEIFQIPDMGTVKTGFLYLDILSLTTCL